MPDAIAYGVLPTWLGLAILVLVSAVAGVINSMAGGGSLLILPILVGLGLPAGVANGTLRVGVLVQSLGATVAFHRRGIREYPLVARLLGPMTAGALGGTWLATQMSDDVLRPLFGALLALWAVVLAFRPGRFLTPGDERRKPGWAAYLGAVAVGVYGGFFQAGVGFPLLALLVGGLGVHAVQANAAKVAFVSLYTVAALPLFAVAGQVRWIEGAALGVGGLVGGWIGTAWQVRSGAGLVRWFLTVAVAASGIAMVVTSLI